MRNLLSQSQYRLAIFPKTVVFLQGRKRRRQRIVLFLRQEEVFQCIPYIIPSNGNLRIREKQLPTRQTMQ